jgi:hypothetical protein
VKTRFQAFAAFKHNLCRYTSSPRKKTRGGNAAARAAAAEVRLYKLNAVDP